MTTLTDWLLAQVAADEEVARTWAWAETFTPWLESDPAIQRSARQSEALRKVIGALSQVSHIEVTAEPFPDEGFVGDAARYSLHALAGIYAERPGFGEWDS